MIATGADLLPRGMAIRVFAAMAAAYFLSALMRSVTGTLAPTLTAEFALSGAQLGLLAGGYFLGFASLQLHLGRWLDRHGPQRVLMAFLCVAVLSAGAFAVADGFGSLLLARVLGGVGVSACLMAPLTGYRRWFSPEAQQRANSWMLMTGSLGMLASTLPVQWLLPLIGWRGVFGVLAACLLLAIVGIAWQVPRGFSSSATTSIPSQGRQPGSAGLWASYQPVFSHPFFRALAPLGAVNYAALLAVQTLWAGPWLTTVVGLTPAQAAQGLFGINLTMLCVFWSWGLLTPRLLRAGWDARRLLVWGAPAPVLCLALIAALGPAAGWPVIALFCTLSSVISLSQPAVGLAFPMQEAGRALSAFNLLIFLGTFVVQWALGLGLDALQAQGLDRVSAMRWLFGVLALACACSYAAFRRGERVWRLAQPGEAA